MDEQTFKRVLSEVDELDAAAGMDMNKLLALSEALRQIFTWIIRKNVFAPDELADHLAVDKKDAQKLINLLTYKGYIEFQTEHEGKYHANVTTSRFIRKYRMPKDVWKLID
jgi:DNA-binding MarR family transcriptional regulator